MIRLLLDTNVLVYAADPDDVAKHPIAKDLLEHVDDSCVAVSAQVLAEYARVLTRTGRLKRDSRAVQSDVENMMLIWEVFPLHGGVVLNALEAHRRWRLPYWDAQIWATAALNAIPVVLSEDFQDGAVLGGVRFINPFADGFDPAVLCEPDE